MWAIAVLMIVPFFWMVSSSFKPSAEVFTYPVEWLPRKWTLNGYRALFDSRYNFLLFYWNTFYVSFMTVVGVLTVGSMAAYAYAKIKFKGRDVFFFLLISTIAIPFQTVMIPKFIIFRHLGLLDTLTSQWIGAFLNPTTAIFLLRQFFKTVHDELIESAKMDGCGHFRILWQIVMPLAKPVLFTTVLIYFVSSWNNYEMALLFIRSLDNYVVSIAVKIFSSEMKVNHSATMAASTISIVPLGLLFIIGQKYLISGLTAGAVKG
jgi:multiple sugar transport system permease protein